MSDFIVVRDYNNKLVSLAPGEIHKALAMQEFKLFGMSMDVIVELLSQYQAKGGALPLTVASVRAVSAGDKSRRWRTIADGLTREVESEDGVLLFTARGIVRARFYVGKLSTGVWLDCFSGGVISKPTHWMPCPSPPSNYS